MEQSVQRTHMTRNRDRIGMIERVLICVYFFLAYFEPYLNGMLGSLGKYIILLLIGVLCANHRNIRIKPFHLCFISWLLFKMVSMLWTSNWYIFELHLFSQIGMVGLLIVLTAIPIDKTTITSILNTMWLGSTAIGVLSLFFSHPYHGVATTRQVLFLFSQEADPNNQAAFLLVGIAIAVYHLIVWKKCILFSVITIAVNTYGLFLTGSRGGLVGLVCVCAALWFTSLRGEKLSKKIRTTLIILLVCTLLYLLAITFLPEEIYNRLFDFSSYEGGSERDIIWGNGWELFTSDLNFLFGAGWGSYYGYNGIYQAMHNTFLSMLCDVGLVGSLVFFVPIVKTCLQLIKKGNNFPVLLLLCGFVPSFFIDAINKRFFWNAIFVLFIFVVNEKMLQECNCEALSNEKNSYH